jgi:hypothetical protein
VMRPATGVGGCRGMVGPFLASAAGETSRAAESGSERPPGARRVHGATDAQAHGVRVAACDPSRCASLGVATTEAGVLTSGTCRRGRPWRARALLQVGTVRDHRGVAAEVRNHITTNLRCITQLLDRARSCQPLLTNPWKSSAILWVGDSLCLGRELSETAGVSPAQVPFRRSAATRTGLRTGTSSWLAPAHTRTERANNA